jgi:hypothetical protein
VTSFSQLVVLLEACFHAPCLTHLPSFLQVVYSLEVLTKPGGLVELIGALCLTPFVRTSPELTSESLMRPKRLEYVSAG